MNSSSQTTDRARWSFRLAVTIWTSLLLGSWLLAARSVAGELSSPLSPLHSWLATGSVALLGLLAEIIHRIGSPSLSPTPRPLVATLSLTPMLTVGLILMAPSDPVAWTGLAVTAVTATLVLYRNTVRRQIVHARRTPRSSRPPGTSVTPTQSALELSQTLRRHRDSNGDRLDGDLTVHWRHGQQHQLVHVPFVPAFEEFPEVTCTCEPSPSDESVRARVADVQRFGTRIELRRSGPADHRQSTDLRISATLSESAHRAA